MINNYYKFISNIIIFNIDNLNISNIEKEYVLNEIEKKLISQ